MHSLYTPIATPGLTLLNKAQIEEIIQAAFLILERTGAIISHPDMLEYIKKAGAEVSGNKVYVPRARIQEAVNMTPKGLMIYDQKGNPAMHLWGRKSYYGTSTASPKTRDALTGEIHETRLVDIEMGIKVADTLENIDFVMPFGSAQDCPTGLGEAWEMLTTMKNTSKPIVFCPYSPKGVEVVIEMAQKVAGGADELRRKPFVICYPEPIAPLTWPGDVLDYMIICAKNHLPQLITGAQLMSMTAPVTMAGCLAQATAESLLSTFMVQSVSPGAPVFMAAIPAAVNPRNGLVSMASPEFQLAIAAQAEIGRSLGLASWGCVGISDSHILDAQAGAESGMTILAQGLAGVNLNHDIGYLGTGIQSSAAMLVFGNENVGYTRRILQGLTINEETLALDVINKVGPGGNYLTHRHTSKNLRSEIFVHDIFNKVAYDQWQGAGGKSTLDKCDEVVKEILATHQPAALSETLAKEFEELIKSKS